MGITGYLVGWRPSTGVLEIALGFIFLLLFGYSLSWLGALVGLSAKDARTVSNVSFLVTFPLTFLSNAFAPTTGMPRALQYFAEWNPVSTMVAACRELFGLENEFGATAGSFPSEHPLVTSVFYMILIMAIFVPLALRKYRRTGN
jgi:ABC-2 type transport system permease protein